MSEAKPVLPHRPGTCAFCSLDFLDVYNCPKCKRSYCTLKCYRSAKHAECSNAFYQQQIAQHMGKNLDSETDSDDHSEPESEDPQPSSSFAEEQTSTAPKEEPSSKPQAKGNPKKKPFPTFAEYMHEHRNEDQRKSEADINPDLGECLGPDEELVIDDEDHQPEYLTHVQENTARDFESLPDDELDQKFNALGIDPNQDVEALLKLLTDDERKAFSRMADDILGFKPPPSAFKK